MLAALATLPHAIHYVVLNVLEELARNGCTCYPGNKILEERCRVKVRRLEQIFNELEALGWFVRVKPPPSCPGRTGFILTKRLHPDSPAADTPEKLALARASLCEQREEKTIPGGRRPPRQSSQRHLSDQAPKSASSGDRAHSSAHGPSALECAQNKESLSLKKDAFPEGGENACNQRQRPGPAAEREPGPEGTMAPRAAMLPAPPPPPPPSPPAAPGPGPAAAAAGDAALAGLTPEERSRFDGLGPGKRAEIRGLLDRGMIEAARSELRRGKAPPPPPPLATLDDAVRALETHGRADPGLLPKVTEGLRVEIGDHPGSWRYLHQQLGRVAAGEVPAAVMLEALGRWRDRMARGRPIEKPAAYFTRTLREKVRRHEGGPDA